MSAASKEVFAVDAWACSQCDRLYLDHNDAGNAVSASSNKVVAVVAWTCGRCDRIYLDHAEAITCCTSNKLKLFVWTEADYTSGAAWALAYNVEHARKLIVRNESEKYKNHILKEVSDDPRVYTRPCGGYVGPSGDYAYGTYGQQLRSARAEVRRAEDSLRSAKKYLARMLAEGKGPTP